MQKLSVYIVSLNEESRLGRTLEAAKQVADEIVVVDSGSTDKTCEIADAFGAKVLFHKWKNISSQKHFAQEQCSNDLVLSLDADEVLSPALIQEILAVKQNPQDAYKIKIADMYPGDKKPRPCVKTYNLVRLYKRSAANMPDDLTHDRVVLHEGVKPIQLKHRIYHYSYLTLKKTWDKLNAYTDELVKTAVITNKSYSGIRLVFEFPYQFLRYYLLKGMFLQGKFGFINAITLSYFRFLKIAKWFEYKITHKEN